jgi:hypothetical protein
MRIKTLNNNTLERRSCWVDLNHIAGTVGIFDMLDNMDIAEEYITVCFEITCPLGVCLVYKYLCLQLATIGDDKRPNLLTKIIYTTDLWSTKYSHISDHPNSYFELRGLNMDYYIQEAKGENISDSN